VVERNIPLFVEKLSSLKKSNYQALDHKESDVTSLNILKACSALQSNLSAISAISHRV